ncbi:hypothetical protein G4B88_019876 [Cannabis sativa]|uniref:beta-galactosidase n=1 Tax=Cannabis sativa TaxID=3483 RepID=A0A7J6HT39_CANSA|nr:hypothetical protein G4B88_019876 [Cannabis sativa]
MKISSGNHKKLEWIWSSKVSAMAKRRTTRLTLFVITFLSLVAFGIFVPVFALLPPLSSHSTHHPTPIKKVSAKKFDISDDKFWKDGRAFQIIGGDLHYFRVLPEPGAFNFGGIANLVSFLKHCQNQGFLVMLRPGPYICGELPFIAEWDLGGFPPWLLDIKPALTLRSSDPAYLKLVERWWGALLPKIAPYLYKNGGPVIMVQIENEYGSYGNDKAYLHHLIRLAKYHLGDDVILYTTDGGTRETLEKGTIRGDAVFSAVDFTTGDNPWPIFDLQKKFNAPGKSPPLSAWHTVEQTLDFIMEQTLDQMSLITRLILLPMTMYELFGLSFDAPIRETGDINNAKFKALRRVIEKYAGQSLPPVPPDNEKIGYGSIHLTKTGNLLDMLPHFDVVESENPMPMDSVGQMFGFLLYVTEYAAKDNINDRILSIPKVHDRAQVLISCSSGLTAGRPTFVGTIERWSTGRLNLPSTNCVSSINLFILVENMGRLNYGQYIFDRKGILSSVYLDGSILSKWKMYKIPIPNLNEIPENNPIKQASYSRVFDISARKKLKEKQVIVSKEPAFYAGQFHIDNEDKIKDTFISFNGWGKGIAIVNDFNVGRFWPSMGPQCNLYVPAPLLKPGENVVMIFELEDPNPELVVSFVDQPDFTCGSSKQHFRHQL